MKYKHTQISFMMIIITIVMIWFFAWIHFVASIEPKSVDSGSNFLVSAVMLLIILIISSFISLQVSIDDRFLKIKFWYGIFKKSFLLEDIISVRKVKNHWYYGWWIRFWFCPKKVIIYNISWFEAIEIELKNWKIYRIGTDDVWKLEQEILNVIKKLYKK